MEIVLFDSFMDFDKDAIVNFCEANDINVPNEGSDEEYRIKAELLEFAEDDLINETLSCCDVPVLVTGRLGLWNSSPYIIPKRYETAVDALRACVSNMDGYKVTLEKGEIKVYAYHHDGCNTFIIHKLSRQGRNLTEDTFYTKTPKPYWFGKFTEGMYCA